MTIKKKTLLWFLIPSILIATITMLFCYFYTRKTVEQNIFDQLEIAADELQGQINFFLREKKGRTLDFSSDGFIRDCTEGITKGKDSFPRLPARPMAGGPRPSRLRLAEEPRLSPDGQGYYTERLNTHLMENKKPLDPDILSVFVVNFDGKIISSTDSGQIGRDVSGEEFFLNTMERGSCISDLRYSQESKQNTFLDVSRLLLSKKEQNPIGIIVNRYKGDSFTKITHSLPKPGLGRGGISGELGQPKQPGGMGETGEVYIVNSDGLMITESRFIEDAIFNQVVDTEGVRVAFDNGVGMIGIYSGYRGIPILGVSKYIEAMDWVVLAEKDVSEAFAPLSRLRNFVIIMGVTGIMVIVTVAVLFARGITRPIRRLMGGTRRIATGDFEHLITVDKENDEIRELGKSFNLMVKFLRESTAGKKQLFLQVKRGRDEWVKTFDAITDIITIHDKDFRILRANKTFFEKFGVNKRQFPGKRCYEIFHDIDTPWHSCPLDRSIKSLRPEIEEVEDPHMGGSFLISVYPLKNERGETYGFVHLAKDITEEKKVEREIIKEKEYTEDLIETAHDAIVCVDEKGTINIWNKSAENVFGYAKSEILGKSISTIIPEEIFDRFLQVSKIITISRVIEVSGKTKDGIVIPIEMSISSREIEKGGYTFTIIMRDITFQKEAKKQLVEKANELRKVNKELEDFVYIVSHDLKEPLFAIGGYTSRLFRLYEDTFDDKGKQYIDRIKVNIERMSQKIQEIMEVLRVGRVAYDFKNNDSGAIVTDVVNTLESKMKAERIKVSIEDNLPTILCDEKRMKDVFSNLVTNAIKFMGNDKQTACRSYTEPTFGHGAKTPLNPPRSQAQLGNEMAGDGGPSVPPRCSVPRPSRLRLAEEPRLSPPRCNRISIGCHKNDSYYKFYVEDTGIGIREEYREQIFKVFRRLKDVETEGTGVGLAIVKKIVEQHKGKIWAESPAGNGRGTRFCFTIPVTKTTSDHHDTHKVMVSDS